MAENVVSGFFVHGASALCSGYSAQNPSASTWPTPQPFARPYGRGQPANFTCHVCAFHLLFKGSSSMPATLASLASLASQCTSFASYSGGSTSSPTSPPSRAISTVRRSSGHQHFLNVNRPTCSICGNAKRCLGNGRPPSSNLSITISAIACKKYCVFIQYIGFGLWNAKREEQRALPSPDIW